jgi:DNA mismatch repair protein MutS
MTEGGLFKQGFNTELDELLGLSEHSETLLQELLNKEQQAISVKLKLGMNRVFGYYFELSRAGAQSPPAHFIRRQSLANAERFVTEELGNLEQRIFAAVDQRKQMEYRLFQKLRATIADARPRILYMATVLAGLDYWQGLAEAARKNAWEKPRMLTDLTLFIREGRHPVVEQIQGKAQFIPNDLRMDDHRRVLLITGPNMAGKSTVLRQTALICLMAHMGSFVPASEARLGLMDRIFTRVGASDNLAQGRSTFMVEMMETARILRQTTKKSLIILDEIGRGTSTFDGLALAWAVLEDLANRGGTGIRTLFATHYHELTVLESRLHSVHNMNIAIRQWGGEIVFLHRLVPGPADKSYGIEVARLAGVPNNVVQQARKILQRLEAKRINPALPDEPAQVSAALPGIDLRPLKQEKAEPVKDTAHPLITTLRDLDPNRLTPIDAIRLINEWKLLWGKPEGEES